MVQLAAVDYAAIPEGALLPGERDISDDEKWALHAANSEIKSEPDVLAGLLAEEARLGDEYQTFAEQRDRVRAFANGESTVLAEMDEISQREVLALQVWAANPLGSPPAPETAAREELTKKLAAAQHATRASGLAADQLEAQMREVHGKQLKLEPRIVAEVVNRLEGEYGAAFERLRRDIAALNHSLARVNGYREALGELGRNLMVSAPESGQSILSRLEALPRPDPASLGATAEQIDTATADWRQRAAALRVRA